MLRLRAGGGGRSNAELEGLPLFKPPYGSIAAINFDKGELAWSVPSRGDARQCSKSSRAEGLEYSVHGPRRYRRPADHVHAGDRR